MQQNNFVLFRQNHSANSAQGKKYETKNIEKYKELNTKMKYEKIFSQNIVCITMRFFPQEKKTYSIIMRKNYRFTNSIRKITELQIELN